MAYDIEAEMDKWCDNAGFAPIEAREKWYVWGGDGFPAGLTASYIDVEGKVWVYFDELFGDAGPDRIDYHEGMLQYAI